MARSRATSGCRSASAAAAAAETDLLRRTTLLTRDAANRRRDFGVRALSFAARRRWACILLAAVAFGAGLAVGGFDEESGSAQSGDRSRPPAAAAPGDGERSPAAPVPVQVGGHGGVPPGTAERLRRTPGVVSVTRVRRGHALLRRSIDRHGGSIDRARAGYAIPLDALVVDAEAYARMAAAAQASGRRAGPRRRGRGRIADARPGDEGVGRRTLALAARASPGRGRTQRQDVDQAAGAKRFSESRELGALRLRDRAEIYIAYGADDEAPIAQ